MSVFLMGELTLGIALSNPSNEPIPLLHHRVASTPARHSRVKWGRWDGSPTRSTTRSKQGKEGGRGGGDDAHCVVRREVCDEQCSVREKSGLPPPTKIFLTSTRQHAIAVKSAKVERRFRKTFALDLGRFGQRSLLRRI